MDAEPKPSERDESRVPSTNLSSASDHDSSASDSETPQKEWLATGRQRRSTAGNRMKSMLANEEPDSDLELLFAEDDDDQGFSDAGAEGSDVQMDSSDDEDENHNAQDDLEGEQELERQAKEKRAAQRKRKAQEAIPAKFRKKVRITSAAPATTSSATPSVTGAATPAPATATAPAGAPRPKKKSERVSWLPSAGDLPTRASSRQTTRLSKEQLHQQMVEREARRLRQLAQMQKKAARLEALKKPPLTQADRLREAALVEERNAKSLNRWEAAEKQREEERRAKLAALNERTLKGPVISFWSGRGTGRHVVLEEKPKKKREKGDKAKEKEAKNKDKMAEKPDAEADVKGEHTKEKEQEAKDPDAESKDKVPVATNPDKMDVDEKPDDTPGKSTEANAQTDGKAMADDADHEPKAEADLARPEVQEPQSAAPPEAKETDAAPHTVGDAAHPPPETEAPEVSDAVRLPAEPLNKEDTRVEETRPDPEGEDEADTQTNAEAVSQEVAKAPVAAASPLPPTASTDQAPAAPAAPPAQSEDPGPTPSNVSPPQDAAKPSGVLAAPVLAPPAGISADGSTPAAAAAGSPPKPKSTVLAPPNTSQGTGPPGVEAPPTPAPARPSAPPAEEQHAAGQAGPLQPATNEAAQPDKATPAGATPTDDQLPPRDTDPSSARNAIVFQNFDENGIKDKTIQTQILFGRKMNRLSKPPPAPACVITSHPARYRDPTTGLPFYNVHAYREIQRLGRGDYRWSGLLGAWAGSGKYAARGVPERFLNPGKAREKKAGEAVAEEEGEEKKKKAEDGGTTDDKNGVVEGEEKKKKDGEEKTGGDAAPVKQEAVDETLKPPAAESSSVAQTA